MKEKEWNTFPKAIIRRDMFKETQKFSKRSKMPLVSKCALMVPAAECLCVKAAMKAGRINEDTHIVAIEQKEEYLDAIADNLRELGIKNVTIVNRSFLSIPKRFIVNNLQGKIPQIDFIYLDLCGLYCRDMLKTFNRFREHGLIQDSIPIAYTAQNTDRAKLWGNYINEDNSWYKFSTIEKTQNNAISLTDHFIDSVSNMMDERYILTYGRAYKNGRDDSAMVTFMTQPKKRTRAPIRESGSKDSYNMGYVGWGW